MKLMNLFQFCSMYEPIYWTMPGAVLDKNALNASLTSPQ